MSTDNGPTPSIRLPDATASLPDDPVILQQMIRELLDPAFNALFEGITYEQLQERGWARGAVDSPRRAGINSGRLGARHRSDEGLTCPRVLEVRHAVSFPRRPWRRPGPSHIRPPYPTLHAAFR